jgi:hypothetical protein
MSTKVGRHGQLVGGQWPQEGGGISFHPEISNCDPVSGASEFTKQVKDVRVAE